MQGPPALHESRLSMCMHATSCGIWRPLPHMFPSPNQSMGGGTGVFQIPLMQTLHHGTDIRKAGIRSSGLRPRSCSGLGTRAVVPPGRDVGVEDRLGRSGAPGFSPLLSSVPRARISAVNPWEQGGQTRLTLLLRCLAQLSAPSQNLSVCEVYRPSV